MRKGSRFVGNAGCLFKLDELHTIAIISTILKMLLAIRGQIE